MKVAALIRKLQKMPQDADFCFSLKPEGLHDTGGYQYRIPKNPKVFHDSWPGHESVCVVQEVWD